MLVALTILSIALAVIVSVFSASLHGRQTAAAAEQATLLAQSKLSAMGIAEPIRQGETTGRFDNQFRWRLVAIPYHEPDRNEAKDVLSEPLLVTLTVYWAEARKEKSVSLTTLRLVPR